MYACNSLLNYLKKISGQSRVKIWRCRVTRVFPVFRVGSGQKIYLIRVGSGRVISGQVKTRPSPSNNQLFKAYLKVFIEIKKKKLSKKKFHVRENLPFGLFFEKKIIFHSVKIRQIWFF